MSDFDKLINASDLIDWIMESYPDWCEGDVRAIVNHIDEMPSVQPKERCIANITLSEEDIERIVKEQVEEIKDSLSRNGKWIDIKHTFMTKCSVCDWINNDDSNK